MKHRIMSLILSLTCLISLAACKRNADTDPTNDPSLTDNGALSDNGNIFASGSASAEYDPNAAHGVKRVYGTLNAREMLEWNDAIGFDYERGVDHTIYYLFDDPAKGYVLCFDPLCDHGGDYCPAFDNDAFEEIDGYTVTFPNHIVLDRYDNADSPVFYRAYKQPEVYNPMPGVSATREVSYRITRYDVSSGRRITLLDEIDGTITSLNTYGDHIYYTESAGDDRTTLRRLHKSGGEPIVLSSEGATTITLLDITDQTVYYTVDERYLYSCSADLTSPERLLDTAELKGSNDKPALLQRIQGGYLYYFGNYEGVTVSKADGTVQLSDLYKWDCFRLPISDLTAEPELVAEDICGGFLQSAFTEHYFYYEPAVFSYSDYSGSLLGVNFSGGDLCAVDLKTLVHSTVVEDCGLNIDIEHTYGDEVIFGGTPADSKGSSIWQDGRIWFRAYPDGRDYHAWINKLSGGELQNYG